MPALLLVSCSAPVQHTLTEDLLVTINFYRSHNIGGASPPTGLLRFDEQAGAFEKLAWEELIASSVAIDASGRWIYLACGNGVLVSRDGGQTWVLSGGIAMAEVQRVWIDVRDPRSAWAASAYGVFHCDDILAEDPWTRLDTDGAFRFCSDVLQDAVDREALWVGTERGIFLLGDGTIERRGPGARVRRIVQDAVDPHRMWATSDGLGLLQSLDGGESWSTVAGSPRICFCVTRPDGCDETLLVGSTDGVHRSDDRGRTWTLLDDGLPDGYFVFAIAVDPADPRHICITGTDGAFESVDAGVSWSRLGLEAALSTDIRFVQRASVPEAGPADAPGSLELPRGRATYPEHRPQRSAGLQARRDELLEHFRSQLPGPEATRLGIIQGILALREEEPDPRSVELLLRELEDPSHSMFFTLPAIALLLHGGDDLPPEVSERLRTLLTEHPVYRGDTENHWVMHYAVMLLAAQTWPETPAQRWYMGRSSASLYAEAREWLLHWARLTATKGQGEFDSPHYMFMFVTPMLLLYDFAEDPEMRQMAGMMLDLLLVDYLSESLHGAYCGGHSRAPSNVALQTRDNRAAGYHYLYAGGIERPEHPHGWLILALLSEYVPPRELAGIANHRQDAFTYTEVKRVRNVIRFGPELNPPVYKTGYMTPLFCLGSLQGGILQPIQQHTWDVTWNGSALNSTLFTVHPSYSSEELGLFFPEELHYLTQSVAAQKGTYVSPDKWISASPWERVYQHHNILLALYRVPEDWNFPHVDLHWPNCLARSTAGGWTFGRDGDFFLACYSTRPGTLIEEEGRDRLRFDGSRTGFVVVTPPAEMLAEGAGAFERFKQMVLACPEPVLQGAGDSLILRFEAPGGILLERRFGDDLGRLARRPAPFPVDQLFRSPFVNGRIGSGVIEMTDGKSLRRLDFNDFSILVRAGR